MAFDGPSKARLLAIVLALVIPGIITVAAVAVGHLEGRRRRRPRTPAAKPAEGPAPEPPGAATSVVSRVLTAAGGSALTSADRDALTTVCAAISGDRVERIRTSTFMTPWHDGAVRVFLDLEPAVVALRERPFSAEVQTTLTGLSQAIAAFAAFYDDNTHPDPLLSETDWRFFDWTEITNAPTGVVVTPRGRWDDRAARMRELSGAVASSYDALREAAATDSALSHRVHSGAPTG
jgi:hypothetical protein